jgi:SAM-dependent methyltransferase
VAALYFLVTVADTFYRSFSEKELTDYGAARRGKIEQSRLALLMPYAKPPGDMLEIGPGHGTLAQQAVAAGYRYRCIEASPILAEYLRKKGFEVTEAFTPPIPGDDRSADVVYADQVLEHMSGIDGARAFVADAKRILRPGGVFFVVVPDYLKERTFFWDVDYTHNFVTTERRVKQLLYDGGFTVERVVRSIGVSTGIARDVLAAGALLVNLPGVDALSRYTKTENLLFKVRKNLFETLTFVARTPQS